MWRLAGVALVLCLGAPAFAAQVAGVTIADRAWVGGQALKLNGAGTYYKFIIRVYVVSLYLPQPVGDLAGVLARGPRRIQMNLLRDLTADQLVGALIGGIYDNNSPDDVAAVQVATNELVRILRAFNNVDVKSKDVITMDFVDGGTRVALNGEPRGRDRGRGLQPRAHPHLAGRQARAGAPEEGDAGWLTPARCLAHAVPVRPIRRCHRRQWLHRWTPRPATAGPWLSSVVPCPRDVAHRRFAVGGCQCRPVRDRGPHRDRACPVGGRCALRVSPRRTGPRVGRG